MHSLGRMGAFLDDVQPGKVPPSDDNDMNDWQQLLKNAAATFQQEANRDEHPSLQEVPSLADGLPDSRLDLAGSDYIRYYYGNRNLNPRLPPPSLMPRSGLEPASSAKQAEHQGAIDAAQTAALAALLSAQTQIQEPGPSTRHQDAFGNMRSHLALSGPQSALPLYATQRFASSCAVLGEVGSRTQSFTSGMHNPWAPPSSGGLSRNDLASNSASHVHQLEGLINAFSPRTSFSNSAFSAHVTAPPGSMMTALDQEVGPSGGGAGAMVDPLFGGGIASANLSPRSSVTSMQAQSGLLDPISAAVGSPVRGSPMSQSFTLGSNKEGKGGLLGHSFGAKQPASRLRVGSTVEFLQGIDLNPGTPGRLSLGLQDSLPSLGIAQNNTADLSAAEAAQQAGASQALAEAEAAASLLASAAAAAAATAPAGQQQQQQQLQAMYLAMSSMGYAPMAYGGGAAGNPYANYYPQQQPQGFNNYPQNFPPGGMAYNGLDAMGMMGMQGQLPQAMPFAQQGMPFGQQGMTPVSPAEYAAFYQRYMEQNRYMENQAVMQAQQAVAAQMGLQPNMQHMDPYGGGLGGQQDGADLGGSGVPLGLSSQRHRSHGGIAPAHFERARGNNLARHSGELHLAAGGGGSMGGVGPGSGSLGMGRSENGADVAMGHMERLHMNLSAGGSGLSGRRSSRREGEGQGPGGRTSALLEEFKANKSRRYELGDVLGHMYEFSLDQHGSRFIQQKLEIVSPEELGDALNEVLPRLTTLMTDVFGNYVVQKFFEHGTPAQRMKLAETLKGQVLQLSLQMYGCRVVQKALEVLPADTQCALLAELDGNVMRCVRDQNGNHVIQKVIECVPTPRITALLDNFLSCVVPLSSHPFGCRVMQRILEHCKDEERRAVVMDEILKSTHPLAQDQYGNYVIQHVLEHGTPTEKHAVVSCLGPHVVTLSMHKFASNVIEKCLTHCTYAERDAIIRTILGPDGGITAAPASPHTHHHQHASVGPGSGNGNSRLGSSAGVQQPGSGEERGGGCDSGAEGERGGEDRGADQEDALQRMMKDQFGNYVVQRVLEVCDDQQRDNLLQRVRAQLHLLKKVTYGKHVVARVEKLLSTGTKIQTHLRARPLPNDTAPLLALRPSQGAAGGGGSGTGGTGGSPRIQSLMSGSLSPENSQGGGGSLSVDPPSPSAPGVWPDRPSGGTEASGGSGEAASVTAVAV